MLEHIVHTNIMRYLEKYKVLIDEQHGFRGGRSFETQLALSVNDLAKALDRQSQADVVIMDFSKALDLVPHQRLLSKFFHYGITGKLHKWIKFFLAMRTQQVVLEDVSSSSITVTSGVPQGTVLGPLLFIFYLIDLPEGISSQVRLLADDCILYREINTLNDCQDLQKDIKTLCNWQSKWQMKFYIDKYHIMHVTHKRNTLLMIYNMNGRQIEDTASHAYLGIGIDNKLSWAEHISNTVSKVNKVLGLLRRNLYSCSPFVKETAYKLLVRLRLEYCSSIWDPYHQEYKNKLESVQRRAARFVCNDLRRQSHVSDMLRDLNWKTLEDRRKISRLTLLYKSVHNIVAINIGEHYTNHEEKISQPEKRPQFPLLILLPERNATGTLLSLGLWLSGTVYLLL